VVLDREMGQTDQVSDIMASLKKRGLPSDLWDAQRCWSARSLCKALEITPAQICVNWKERERTLARTSDLAALQRVWRSGVFEFGSSIDRSGILLLNARQQDPREDSETVILATLWAADAAQSQAAGVAVPELEKGMVVGYDMTGARPSNFSLSHARAFSKVLLTEYPTKVESVYLIGTPFPLRCVLALIKPFVSQHIDFHALPDFASFEAAVSGFRATHEKGGVEAMVGQRVPAFSRRFGLGSEIPALMRKFGQRPKNDVSLGADTVRECVSNVFVWC